MVGLGRVRAGHPHLRRQQTLGFRANAHTLVLDWVRVFPRGGRVLETALTNFEQLIDESDNSERTLAERSDAAARSTWVSVGVNMVLSGLQITVGVLAKSQGLIADGIHSLSDLVADFVVLFASHHGAKEADADHPYGHQRFENAASMVVGALLLAVGAGMAWSAIGKLENPESIPVVHAVALAVAAVALVAKEILFRYMLKIATRVKSSMLVANAWHARSDAASSLVVGIGIAGNLAGSPLLDPIAALIVGLMIAKMGWGFAWDALHELMDRGIDEEEVAAITSTLAGTPGVMGRARHTHPQDGRHDRGRCPHRGRCDDSGRSRTRHRSGRTPQRDGAPPRIVADGAR